VDKYQILTSIFNLEFFRPYQEEIIDSIFDKNTNGLLVVIPTGGGKSLLYQIPSIINKNLTIVISPLISLMKNQVDFLKSKNISADFYNSSLTDTEKRNIETKLMMKELKILYVAPERFGDANFTKLLKESNDIDLFVVDEAHCISMHGHDFRPSYRMLTTVIEYLKPKQIIALTATATKKIQSDICKQLNMVEAKKYITGFYRPDLSIIVKICSKTTRTDNIVKQINYFINNNLKTGIIYCPTRKVAESIFEKLQQENINSTLYHAGLSNKVREDTQNNWFKNGGIIVATIAFGMGIDKADVRFILHIGITSSLENYYQEIGRASRDGNGAKCIIYFDAKTDINLQKFFIEMQYPPSYEIRSFWRWCCSEADKNDLIIKTQKEMSNECDFIKSCNIPGCVSKLRENKFIETVSKGKYKIYKNKDIYKEFDFEKLENNKQIKLNSLYEMSEFINTNSCRMLQIVRHFDDYSQNITCGKCDICIQKMLKNKPI